MFNDRIRPITLFSFFPKNKRLRLKNKEDLKKISNNKSKVILKKLIKKQNKYDSISNQNSKIRLNSQNKERKLISQKENEKRDFIPNYIRTGGLRANSIQEQNSINSQLFQQFITHYENKVKKALFDIENTNKGNKLPFLKSPKQNDLIRNNFRPYREIYSTGENFDLLRNYNPINLKKDHRASSSNNNQLGNALQNTKINDKLNKYLIGKDIGKGAYAIVKLVTDKITRNKYAMKIYDRIKLNDSTKRKCVYREIEIMKRIDHKNIVKLNEVIQNSKQILIIMEYVNGISMREYYNKNIKNQKLNNKKELIIKKYFSQIFSAMSYIHKNHMAHRDIKLENILIDKNQDIKIIDFGFGMYNPEDKLQNFFCGTPNYMPPEIIIKKNYIGQKADLWSLGVLLYKMSRKGKFSIPDYINDKIKSILFGLININPDKRISCDEVLKNDWFN